MALERLRKGRENDEKMKHSQREGKRFFNLGIRISRKGFFCLFFWKLFSA